MRRTVLVALLVAGCAASPEPAPRPQRKSVFSQLGEVDGGRTTEPPKPKHEAKPDASLLPRKLLFSNPDRLAPQISPDGKRIAFLASDRGVLNVFVAPVAEAGKATVVTHDKKRGIRVFKWAQTSEHVLYLQDEGGDENFHLFVVDLKAGKERDLTPRPGVQARLERVSARVPNEVVVAENDRDKRYHDLYRVDVTTGARKLLQKNDGYASIVVDDLFHVRFATKPAKDGSLDILVAAPTGEFAPYLHVPHEDALTTRVVGFDKSGKKAYLVDSRDRDTAALVELDVASKKLAVLVDDGQADVREVVQHPTDRHVQAAVAAYDRVRWHVVDPSLRADLDVLARSATGDLSITSRTNDDTKWLVSASVSDGPVKFYLYDRNKKKADYLFADLAALENKPLAKTHPVVVKSRDGLDLVSYLSLPPAADKDGDARPDRPLPMVLTVHGGPWSRDEWGLNRWHQWLTSRGYAVMSVNYRGSVGFGKKFVNAADGQWAGKMHADLLDAVAWATAEKIADKDRVAIMGGSYGGYATLVGLSFTPDTFACGVDIVGPSNLVTLLQSIPPYWESEVEMFTKRIGDHRTDAGRAFLLAHSPLSRAGDIKRPLLVGQGANDPRVKQSESDQIAAAMKKKNTPLTYVLYPDEGHGFARPENRTSFNAVAELFLAQCLGGSYEPIGSDFAGASITVPLGKENVPTLADALK